MQKEMQELKVEILICLFRITSRIIRRSNHSLMLFKMPTQEGKLILENYFILFVSDPFNIRKIKVNVLGASKNCDIQKR